VRREGRLGAALYRGKSACLRLVGGGPEDNGNGSSEVIGGYGGRRKVRGRFALPLGFRHRQERKERVASSLVREQREKQRAKDKKKEGRDRESREERGEIER
jgi:hypothetical protein